MKGNRGFTIIELMIVIVIVAIGVALAIPSFRDLIERKAVGGAAEAAYEQLQIARSHALKRSKAILVDFYPGVDSTDTNWAVGITDKMAGCDAEDTSGSDLCTIDYDNDAGTTDPIVMRIMGSNHKNITMSQVTGFADPAVFSGACDTASPTNEQACFDFVRGLARTGEYNFASSKYTLQVQVNQLGHVKVCVPGSVPKVVGYDDC